MAGRVSGVDRATTLASGWALSLAVLAFAWARMPLEGSGTAFLIWSAPGVVLARLSWSWLRGTDLPDLRLTPPQIGAGAVVWLALAVLTASGAGAEWALDGLILRNAPQRLAGVGLRWAPGLFGALVAVGGLAVALEARYRLTHPAGADGSPAEAGAPVTPPGP